MGKQQEIVPPYYKSDPVRIPPQSPVPYLDDEPTVRMLIPFPVRYRAARVNWGMLLAMLFCAVFWAGVGWALLHKRG